MSKFDDDFENSYNNDSLEKTVKKAKRKSFIRNTFIVIITLVVCIFINSIYNITSINKLDESLDEEVESSVPTGYISKANYTAGILGGKVEYNISKNIGGRVVTLENKTKTFGINPPMVGLTKAYQDFVNDDSWGVNLWDNGYRKMLFFHPKIKYKKYKNDLANMEDMDDEKIIEMAISLDKAYKIDEIVDIAFDLRNLSTKWIWLDTFNKQEMNEYKQEVNEYDPKSCGINESEVKGLNYGYSYNNGNIYQGINYFNGIYNNWMDSLKESRNKDSNKLYDYLSSEGKKSSKNIEILGFIVEGSKEELELLLDKSYIKGATFGIAVDPLY